MTKKKIYVNESDIDFQSLLKSLNEEYVRVSENIEYAEIRDDPSVFENERVTYPNVCEEFGQLDVLEYHPDIIQLLKKILPQTEEVINIYFQIDFAAYIISIKDIYNKIFEETFPYFLFWNSAFPKKLLSLINDWHRAFNKRRMPLEILLPLKGYYLSHKKKTKNILIKFKDQKNIHIYLKKIPEYGLLKKTPFGGIGSYLFGYISSAGKFAHYGIYAKGEISFQLESYNEPEFNQCYLWKHIKEVAVKLH